MEKKNHINPDRTIHEGLRRTIRLNTPQ